MFEAFDKLKKQAVNAGTTFVKNLKTKNIQPCEGAEYEYCGNDEDYNEFLKNVGTERQDYVNITEENGENTPLKSEKGEENVKKIIDNISETIYDKFNQIKGAIEENKSTGTKADAAKAQAEIDSLLNSTDNLSNEVKNISQILAVLKLSTDEQIKSSKTVAAETSLSVERLIQDIDVLREECDKINGSIEEFKNGIDKQAYDFEQLKNECRGLSKTINTLNADVSDVSANQQMSKNSILALAESFDALNKKITIGFVTLGVLTALSVIIQIVFNIL